MSITQTRRRFLTVLSLAGAVGLVRAPWSLAAERAPETPTVRLPKPSLGGVCIAPGRIVGDLLRAEGFTDIRYVPVGWVTLRRRSAAVGWISL